MIRTRTPGGVATPQQWLKLDAIATRYANHSLRVTTRQAFQFHGVIKRELKTTLAAINASLIDTLAACGDVNRNVLSAANPLLSSVHATVYEHAKALVRIFPAEDARVLRDLARRGAGRRLAGARADLRHHVSAAQVQDRVRGTRRSMTSTSSRTIWAISRSSRTASSSATTSPSAAASARATAIRRRIRAWPT